MPKLEKTVKSKGASPLERFRSVFVEVDSPKGGLPTMPTKISDLPSDALGDLMARYSSWREFTECRHLEACAVYSQIKSEYDLATDKLLVTSTAGSVTERKAMTKSDPKVEGLYKQLSEAGIYVDLLARKLDSFSNVLTVLSRELTRRGVNF